MDNKCGNNCRCDSDGNINTIVFTQENHSDTFLRVVEEKRELDERIRKLKAFLDSFSEYSDLVAKVGSDQAADALYRQLDIMIEYSNALNIRLVLWKN